MGHVMNRALLATVSSAGLLVGGAMSASAHQSDHRDHHDWGKGWLTVCQTVKDQHRYPGHDDWGDHGHKAGDSSHKNGYDDRSSTIDSRYRYGDDGRDHYGDRNSYTGRYLVRDSRGQTSWVTLTGKRDCESLKVNRGWAKVSVVHRPDNARLTSDRSVWVKANRYDRATAAFTYEAKKDSRHYADSHR